MKFKAGLTCLALAGVQAEVTEQDLWGRVQHALTSLSWGTEISKKKKKGGVKGGGV